MKKGDIICFSYFSWDGRRNVAIPPVWGRYTNDDRAWYIAGGSEGEFNGLDDTEMVIAAWDEYDVVDEGDVPEWVWAEAAKRVLTS
jgi:hypothetical protein